ncbi:LuxR C-terminal-related transcriptional regulator [Pontibacter pamirensis]|uniref:LuxR C-terminal-related transcriptional regulator n=1 Tax=Pontibacter pamirensis TaxID=2562824 RepID=UPI0013899890|nr:LuxR C-terminal-related transcriptional regulator [Pontibacter pamirensis]
MKDLYSLEGLIHIFRKSFAYGSVADYESFIPNTEFEKVLNQSYCFCFSIDFSKMRYIYLSEGTKRVLGYDRDEWFKKGLDFAFQILLPSDRETLKQIHEELFRQYYSFPVEARKKLSFTFDFNVRAANGSTVRLNHYTTFVKIDPSGNPLVDFSICTDITPVKSTGPSLLTIKKEDELVGMFSFEGEGKEAILSKREKEVLKLLSDGLTSERIGEKLFITTATVSTHRKNMLQKTGCKNTVELVKFAKSKGEV